MVVHGFKGILNIPNSVQKISSQAFMNCSGLTGLSLSNNLTSINPNTFSGCINLSR